MRADRPRRLLITAMLAVLPLLAGCLTARQQAMLLEQPHSRVFDPAKADLVIPPAKAYTLTEWDRSGAQDLMLLLLAPNAKLDKRYHKVHDLTLVMVRGTAIVTVEETRYAVGPGSAVFVPRMTAYSVTPQKAEDGKEATQVAALLIFTPPYDPLDAFVEK